MQSCMRLKLSSGVQVSLNSSRDAQGSRAGFGTLTSGGVANCGAAADGGDMGFVVHALRISAQMARTPSGSLATVLRPVRPRRVVFNCRDNAGIHQVRQPMLT